MISVSTALVGQRESTCYDEKERADTENSPGKEKEHVLMRKREKTKTVSRAKRINMPWWGSEGRNRPLPKQRSSNCPDEKERVDIDVEFFFLVFCSSSNMFVSWVPSNIRPPFVAYFQNGARKLSIPYNFDSRVQLNLNLITSRKQLPQNELTPFPPPGVGGKNQFPLVPHLRWRFRNPQDFFFKSFLITSAKREKTPKFKPALYWTWFTFCSRWMRGIKTYHHPHHHHHHLHHPPFRLGL